MSSGTPFISLLEPTPLPWEKGLAPADQPDPASIPRTFLDAMTVRTQVFVQEQNIPQANEFDSDDPRSAHWVIYASVNQTVEPAVTDPATGEIIRPRQSETRSVPIGTVRLVPFPHPPHPEEGGVYVDGELVSPDANDNDKNASSAPSKGTTNPAPHDTTASLIPSTPQEISQEPTITTTSNAPPLPKFTPDRPTTHHDGYEPYVKLGRLAVTREFRGRGIAGQLVRTAVDWMRKHPSYFDPSPAEHGFEQLGMDQGGTLPRWNGLFCCHAQVDAVKVWEKCGFVIDEGMGTWMEEGIPHVGMFLRVEVEPEVKQV